MLGLIKIYLGYNTFLRKLLRLSLKPWDKENISFQNSSPIGSNGYEIIENFLDTKTCNSIIEDIKNHLSWESKKIND